jgi:hypothetical protein
MPVAGACRREGAFTLDQNGFVLPRKPSVELAFKDEAAITGAYNDEYAAIGRGATGAQIWSIRMASEKSPPFAMTPGIAGYSFPA